MPLAGAPLLGTIVNLAGFRSSTPSGFIWTPPTKPPLMPRPSTEESGVMVTVRSESTAPAGTASGYCVPSAPVVLSVPPDPAVISPLTACASSGWGVPLRGWGVTPRRDFGIESGKSPLPSRTVTALTDLHLAGFLPLTQARRRYEPVAAEAGTASRTLTLRVLRAAIGFALRLPRRRGPPPRFPSLDKANGDFVAPGCPGP